MLQKMGKAVIFSWDEAQERVVRWAKNYFGDHVNAGISSSLLDYSPETAFITVNGFRTEDFEKFEALFTNTPDCDLFADEEFVTGNRNCILPSSVTLSVAKRVFASPALASINSVYALNDVGLLVMENSLMDWDELNKPHA